MKIIAEARPYAYLKAGQKPININKVENELNGLLEQKDWWKLGEKTDRELNPDISILLLTFEGSKEELAQAPDFIKTRLKYKETK